jgi:single-stranded DNA-specific DHH superfamily exonuclease
MFYDVFNGDADGLCALVQLRLAEPRDSVRITGVKRDIALLNQVPVQPDLTVTVLDINFDSNRQAAIALLEAGAQLFYVDHHNPGGELPESDRLTALIDTAPNVCTSLLVDRYLQGAHAHWATVGAFGDNLREVALARCQQAGLSAEQISKLDCLGVYLNYNGYGATVEDLHFHPAKLYDQLIEWSCPLDFIRAANALWQQLEEGYQSDMSQALAIAPDYADESVAVICLPDAPWSRRVSGVLGNELANRMPTRAHAVITQTASGDLLVSVRAPLSNPTGADDLVKQFPSGGGRKAAAGINRLPVEQLPAFIDRIKSHWR